MGNKRGRPPLDDARRYQYTLHLNDEEQAMFDYVAERTGKNKADILRDINFLSTISTN